MREETLKEQELIQILKLIAPGSNLREGLENILKAHGELHDGHRRRTGFHSTKILITPEASLSQ